MNNIAIALFMFVTMAASSAMSQTSQTKYFKYQSHNNGISVAYPEGLKVTCDDEMKLEVEDDRISFSALFCEAATLSRIDLKADLEKVIKKTGIDKRSISMMELTNNETVNGSLYIGGNKAENADYYLIYGFVQCKLSPQIAFKISVVCNSDMAKEAGTMLGTFEFYPELMK